ncbi:hypothetical protein HaLaN_24756 [Haematococcus lacustris]|uniref:Uncharacterized protein n=1 Tax=Haematococcus lacustris TaxID=44745 RepID=A0A6A0A4W3_HAELA|nr:hypothetical protein HaLaN_24756 [Haematococcus lacustris]
MAAMAAIITFSRNSLTLSSVLAILGCLAFLEVALARASWKSPQKALEKHERAQQHKRELLHARFPVEAKMFAAEVH